DRRALRPLPASEPDPRAHFHARRARLPRDGRLVRPVAASGAGPARAEPDVSIRAPEARSRAAAPGSIIDLKALPDAIEKEEPMQSVRFVGVGRPAQLQEVPKPSPGPGQ